MSLTTQHYMFCQDCNTYFDLWKYDNLADAGHEGCKVRHVTGSELTECVENCKQSGCFEENGKNTNNPEYVQARSIAEDALTNLKAEFARLNDVWQEMEYQSGQSELCEAYPFQHDFSEMTINVSSWVDRHVRPPTKVYKSKIELVEHIIENRSKDELAELVKPHLEDLSICALLEEEGYFRKGTEYEIEHEENGEVSAIKVW